MKGVSTVWNGSIVTTSPISGRSFGMPSKPAAWLRTIDAEVFSCSTACLSTLTGDGTRWNCSPTPCAPWIHLARASATLADIVQRHHGQRILIAGHGETTDAAALLFLGLTPGFSTRAGFETRHGAARRLPHAGLRLLRQARRGSRLQSSLRRYGRMRSVRWSMGSSAAIRLSAAESASRSVPSSPSKTRRRALAKWPG